MYARLNKSVECKSVFNDLVNGFFWAFLNFILFPLHRKRDKSFFAFEQRYHLDKHWIQKKEQIHRLNDCIVINNTPQEDIKSSCECILI